MRAMRIATASAVLLLLAACATAPHSAVNSAPAPSVTVDVGTAPFVGSAKSRKFYARGCHTIKLIAAADQVGFLSLKDAEAAGFVRATDSTDCP